MLITFTSKFSPDVVMFGNIASVLLNAMGQAEADDLGLEGGPLYDPLGNYRTVARSWNDWASDPRHQPVATRTVTPQEAVVPITQGVTPPQQ